MTRQIPTCPVCGNTLKATGADPDTYYCVKRKIWISDLGIHADIVDAAINVSPEGKVRWQHIEVPPYSFIITDDEKGQSTVVRKLMAPERLPAHIRKTFTYEKKTILTIKAIMNLPWNNKQKVMERMKMFLLFS